MMKIASLQELRERYPEYESLSDEQFLTGIQRTYFQDMPLTDFYKATGYESGINKETTKLNENIGAFIPESKWGKAKDFEVQGDLTPYLSTAPRESNVTASAIVDNPTTWALVAGSTGIENMALGMQQMLSGITGQNTEELASRNAENEALYEMTKNRNTTGNQKASPYPAMAGRFGAETLATLPTLAIPGLREAKVGQMGTQAAKDLMPYLANYFSKAAAQGGAAGAMGYVEEDESRTANAATSAALSTVLSKLLLPAQLLADFPLYKAFPMSNKSSEELIQTIATTEGTKTPVFNALGNEEGRSFYTKVIAPMPYSGAIETNQEIQKQIKERGEGILKESTGRDILKKENVAEIINSDLYNRANYKIEKGNENYKEVREQSDKQNINVENRNSYENAEEKFEYYGERDPRLAALIKPSVLKFLQIEKSLKPGAGGQPASEVSHLKSDQVAKAINRIMEEQGIYKGENRKGNWSMIEEEGAAYKPGKQQKPLGPIPVTLADTLRSKELESARKFAAHGDDTEAYIMNSIAEAQRRDIDEAIDMQGTPELKKKLAETRKYYREEVTPITENKFLSKYSDEDANLVGLKAALNDNNNIETFKNFMGEESTKAQQDMVALFFQDSLDRNGELNIPKFISIYNKMDPTKKEILGLDQKKINGFMDLFAMNPESANPTYIPKTGFGALPLQGMLSSYALGHSFAGPAGGIATLLGSIKGGKAITKKLHDESFRKKVLEFQATQKLRNKISEQELKPGSNEYESIMEQIRSLENDIAGVKGTPGWMSETGWGEMQRLLSGEKR